MGLFSILADLRTAQVLHLFGMRQFLPNGSVLNKIAPALCKPLSHVCNDAIFLFCGRTRHINVTRLPVYLAHTPAGTSVKNMEHWAQLVRINRFGMYDYGSAKANMDKYNTSSPPVYKLSDVSVKTALFTGSHDILADPKDVEQLVNGLPTASVVYHKNIEDYAHLDFSWAEDAHSIVYPDVVNLVRKYSDVALHKAIAV